ncbi:hypothetical protein ZIOFF_075659 [Zingiber officinale]|uniref:RING-type E3 ubiquitin transferase n=2 Tax=Zingiber officinale TaxID=94328 RepID=A0A8J5E8D5_ZINOF|nr:hypothetical protein ZIOFF_075659 [Zingiber officinale]
MSSEAFRDSTSNSSPLPLPPPQIASFPILAISVAGILATSILLLICYVFVIKCSLNEHHFHRRRRGHGHSTSLSPAADQLGVAESTIREIPTLRYRQQRVGAAECAVCLSEFQEQERIKLLPNCRHFFHIDCIDTWLQSNANCPLCRGSIVAPIPLHPLALTLALQLGHPHDVVLQIRDEERKIEFSGSRGDECIDAGKKEEKLRLQPLRRSFSADSSGDMLLHVALQRILQKSSNEESSFGGGRSRVIEFGVDGGPTAKLLASKYDAFANHVTLHLDVKILEVDMKHVVSAAIAIKGLGGLLFIFSSSFGAYLLVIALPDFRDPILFDFYNYDIQKPEFVELFAMFTQNLALSGALLFFLGMKNSIPRQKSTRTV